MMGERQVDQAKLFYEFSLERHVPQDHLLRSIDRFVDLEGVRAHLASFYSPISRTAKGAFMGGGGGGGGIDPES